MEKIDYNKRKEKNINDFINDTKKFNALKKFSYAMDKFDIRWALSCSSVLYFNGVHDVMNDFDIVIPMDQVENFLRVFLFIGGTIDPVDTSNGKEDFFESGFFRMGHLDGIDFDIISNFTPIYKEEQTTVLKNLIVEKQYRYTYYLDVNDISYSTIENDKGEFINIPLIPMEANTILYGMQWNWNVSRRKKYGECLNYLMQQGIECPELLKESLDIVPPFIKDTMIYMLEINKANQKVKKED